MQENGWKIQHQVKEYGAYVKVTIGGGSLRVEVAPNPVGLMIDEVAGMAAIQATRVNADRIGYALQRFFDDFEAMRARSPVYEFGVEEPTVVEQVQGLLVSGDLDA